MSHVDPLSPEGDPFGPPAISTLVHCLHCGEEYDSYRIEWRVETRTDGSQQGFWCCPTKGCGGIGFGFDIFPIDPEYRDENGELLWCSDDDVEDGDQDAAAFDEAAFEEADAEGPPDAPTFDARRDERSAGDDFEDDVRW
jgi:hypothetical protein